MNLLFKNLILLVVLALYSSIAAALVWGEGNWGEANWGVDEVRESVPPPAGPVPVATKVRSITGATTNAGFSAGAYADSGEPVYGSSFVADDFITIIGEVTPDPDDVGTNGEIVVVLLSVIGGKLQWSFLNTDGNFENWDLDLKNLGAAEILEPLDTLHAITIFEGNLQVGAHRLAFGYMAEGGPLIYTPKAINIVVGQ